jgi:membrane protease YdiL (CAAX protease family)
MAWLLPVFLIETASYLACGFPQARAAFASIPGANRQALLLVATGLAPFLLLRLGSSYPFEPRAMALLAGLLAIVAFWYVVLPRRLAFDAGFLVVAAAPLVARLFPRLYPTEDTRLHVDILGHLMWFRVTLLSFFVIRGWESGPLSFWPAAREWRIGALLFPACAVVLAFAAGLFHFATFSVMPGAWWLVAAKGIGTFFGILWVVAFWEEAFCRGVIVPALTRAALPMVLVVGLSSVAFGGVHLWYNGFPNWPYFGVASIAGVFYAIAYLRTGSTRASMVTHALTVTCWRLLFH